MEDIFKYSQSMMAIILYYTMLLYITLYRIYHSILHIYNILHACNIPSTFIRLETYIRM